MSPVAVDPSVWVPPAGWYEVRPGIWEPARYEASPWELTPPAVATPTDAIREYLRCASSLPYFALNYCFTLHTDDPSGPRMRRLPAYPFVRELLADLQTPQNLLTEKSRQMLTSWVYMAAFLYDLLFSHNTPMLVVSMRAREVDDAPHSTPITLLGKLRFMHDRLPPFLWHPFSSRQFEIRSTRTASFVKGETGAGGQVARGPSYRRALFDEAAHAEHSEAMFSGLGQSCKTGLALNSTANGHGNVFYRIAHAKPSVFLKRTYHWIRHPEKSADLACLCGWTTTPGKGLADAQFAAHRPKCPRTEGARPTSAWYRHEQAKYTPEQIASELDIDYERSTEARVFDGYDAARHFTNVAELIDRRTKRPIGDPVTGEADLAYRRRALAGLLDPRHQIVIFWDFGVSDETYICLGQVESDGLQATRWLDEIVDKNKAWTYYHRLIASVWYPAYLEACGWTPDEMKKWAIDREFDWSKRAMVVPDLQNEVPRGCLPVYHAGDPAGRARDFSLSSPKTYLEHADPPMLLHTVPFAGRPEDGSALDWIDHVRQLVRHDRITLTNFCLRLADAMADWRWPTDRNGQVLPGRQQPVHDKHSHPGTALVYGYRTRWQGRLLTADMRVDRPSSAMVVTERDDRTRRREPELWTEDRRGRRRRLPEAISLIGREEDDDDED